MTFSDQLRAIISQTGRRVSTISKAAKIGQGPLRRFLKGEAVLTTATLDKLALVLGLVLHANFENLPKDLPIGQGQRNKKEKK